MSGSGAMVRLLHEGVGAALLLPAFCPGCRRVYHGSTRRVKPAGILTIETSTRTRAGVWLTGTGRPAGTRGSPGLKFEKTKFCLPHLLVYKRSQWSSNSISDSVEIFIDLQSLPLLLYISRFGVPFWVTQRLPATGDGGWWISGLE
ncbi:hypothetical protein K438DRAFT_1773933 [Mycena galopus ATCC 62051]|nr:hypothetical protein K438DRAFT_1773933 [Mycena galopus ATCC 62051]